MPDPSPADISSPRTCVGRLAPLHAAAGHTLRRRVGDATAEQGGWRQAGVRRGAGDAGVAGRQGKGSMTGAAGEEGGRQPVPAAGPRPPPPTCTRSGPPPASRRAAACRRARGWEGRRAWSRRASASVARCPLPARPQSLALPPPPPQPPLDQRCPAPSLQSPRTSSPSGWRRTAGGLPGPTAPPRSGAHWRHWRGRRPRLRCPHRGVGLLTAGTRQWRRR
jgi:hypothetical protein